MDEKQYTMEISEGMREMFLTVVNHPTGDVDVRRSQIFAHIAFTHAFLVAKVVDATDDSIQRSLNAAQSEASARLQDMADAGILPFGDYRH